MSDVKSINMVGDDGNVYSINVSDLAKIAKKVPHAQLSNDVQSAAAAPVGAHGHSSIFVAHSDIFTASKNDIAPAGPGVQDIFASHAFIFREGGDPGEK